MWWAGGTALLAAAIVYESVRSRPELAEGVQSRPPGSAEEISRLESGFKLNVTREGQVLFDLLADSQVGMKGGATFLKGVRSFTFYTDDGRPVVVSAARGQLEKMTDRATVNREIDLMTAKFTDEVKNNLRYIEQAWVTPGKDS